MGTARAEFLELKTINVCAKNSKTKSQTPSTKVFVIAYYIIKAKIKGGIKIWNSF